jgi:Flp pilus assembly protein TadG
MRLLARDEEGTALIEGAIIVPVLCILLFGVYEFSWFFYQQHLISTGLRDAARYLARLPTPCNAALPNWKINQARGGRPQQSGLTALRSTIRPKRAV